jgi:hypothetical protein
LRDVESGAQTFSNRRKAGGSSSLWGRAAYAGSLACAIDIEDHPLAVLSIHQIACLPLFRERAALEIVEKECAQGFDWLLGQSREIA